MANSMDPDQTAPVGSWSRVFTSILNLSVMLGNYLQQTTSVGALRVNHFLKVASDFFRSILDK